VRHCLRDPTFSRFDTIPECDRQTHRHTHRHTNMAYTALSIASRGKNGSRDVTTPISGTVCSPCAGLATIDLCTKFEISTLTHFKDIQETLLLQRDRARHLSVEILQLQNISLENPIVWHYLCDSTFSRFDTIPKCDRHTQTDGQTHDDGIYRT